jgi:hypothetical protein
MKTEKFDEAIKQKVESIDHRFEEKEIEKVLHYVNSHRGPSIFRGPFRQFILFSFSAIVITTISTWQLTKWHDHKILNETVAELKKYNGSDHQANNVSHSATNNNENTSVNNNSTVLNGNAINENIAIFSNTKKENSLHNYNKQEKANKIGRQKSIQDDQSISETSKKNSNDHQNNGHTATDQESDKQNGITEIHKDKISTDKLVMNINDNQNITTLSKKEKPDSTMAELKEKRMLPEIKKPESQKDIKTYRGPKYDKKLKSHPDFHIFAGGDFSIGDNNQLGAGLTSEIILNRKFGFSAGIRVLGMSTTSPYSESNYNEICGENFHDRYERDKDRNLTTIDSITNQSNIIQVPLSFFYFIPLKNNFAVSVSLGTDLDLYKYQELSFRETTVKYYPPPYRSQVTHQERNNNGNGIMFNNAIISAGILKQWGHYAVELSPYFSYQLKNSDYKLENYYVGCNLKLLYSFGKGGF